jgi:hypothetical protein
MVNVTAHSALKQWLALVALGLVLLAAFSPLVIQASNNPDHGDVTTTVTHTKTVYHTTTVYLDGTKTVTSTRVITRTKTLTTTSDITTTSISSCTPITGPPGRVYCGPLFDILSYSIVAHNNSASVTLLILYTETAIDSAKFSNNGVSFDLSCSSTTPGSTYLEGQVVNCSSSGFTPPITTSIPNVFMSVSAHNPGDTELFLTQSWGASFLTITP